MRRRWRRWGSMMLPIAGALGSDDAWWKPGPGVNFDWRLAGTPRAAAGVTMFDLDLFDVDVEDIQTLKAAGIVVICYFSAGSYEQWREDEANFPRSALGNKVDFSDGEWWININDADIKVVMTARLDRAVAKGCDGVDPDYVEAFAYGEDVTGWDISFDQQLEYNTWIADQAHYRNLSVGLKNDKEQIRVLEPWFDWALSTDCYAYDTCDAYEPFINAGKAVLDAEFEVGDLGLCNDTRWDSIDFIVKGWELDDSRCSCGYPETNFGCESLLSENNPTEAPLVTDADAEGGPVDGGDEDEGTPTWVIVTAIAMLVLVAMMTYGAVIWRGRILRRKAEGVEDFCE